VSDASDAKTRYFVFVNNFVINLFTFSILISKPFKKLENNVIQLFVKICCFDKSLDMKIEPMFLRVNVKSNLSKKNENKKIGQTLKIKINIFCLGVKQRKLET